MAETSPPLFLDWSFWAVIVSVFAIALSQLPPVIQWFKGPRLDIELYSRMAITHKVGNPNLHLHIIITNVGGINLRVKAITIRIKRDDKFIFSLPAQSFLIGPNDKSSVLFTPVRLKPLEDWSHIVIFLNFFDRQDERRYRKIEWDLRSDIQAKGIDPKLELHEADFKNVEPALKFFEEKFNWLAGEYEMSVTTTADKVECEKIYRFAIFESQSEELKALSNLYKYGDGIYWEHNVVSKFISVELHEIVT